MSTPLRRFTAKNLTTLATTFFVLVLYTTKTIPTLDGVDKFDPSRQNLNRETSKLLNLTNFRWLKILQLNRKTAWGDWFQSVFFFKYFGICEVWNHLSLFHTLSLSLSVCLTVWLSLSLSLSVSLSLCLCLSLSPSVSLLNSFCLC